LAEEVARSRFFELLVTPPIEVIYVTTVGIAVRMAATAISFADKELGALAESAWRAVTGLQ
jgi:hypothetical protein